MVKSTIWAAVPDAATLSTVAGISTVRPHESVNWRVAAAEALALAALVLAAEALADADAADALVLAALLLDELVQPARANAATHSMVASTATAVTRILDDTLRENMTPPLFATCGYNPRLDYSP